jgi:Flp pilus assembly protein TadD
MSNNFPKVSPDGRWIVFVQCRNGLLMRPDSKLYIVPFGGGKPRLMKCNTSLMNSWHTFSPNGRWLAFSSKARSPYTRLMLTHIDAHGNDTPAIIVDNTTAANRAVNIPEFVNIPPGGLGKIDPQAMQFYRVANQAFELMQNNEMAEAIQVWHKALEMDPDNAGAHFSLAMALTGNNQEREAVEEYRKACELDTHQSGWFAHLGASLGQTGDLDGAVANYRKSLELDPSSAGVEADLGAVLLESGRAQEGLEHMQKAVEMAPDFADGHSYLGTALAKVGRFDEAIEQMQTAINLVPSSAEYQFNFGFVFKLHGDYARAATAFEKAVELSEGKNSQCLAELAEAYDKSGRSPEALAAAQRALELAMQEHDERLERQLRGELEGYQRNAAKAKRQ